LLGSYALKDDGADLDQVLDGAFEQNSFADPTNLNTCYDTDADLSKSIFDEITLVLQKASSGKLADLLAL
jgi:hypothetical protein